MICIFDKCLTYTEAVWLGIGFFGQGVFFLRWVVQWWASERHAESRVPIAFWYISLIGGLITLIYAIHIKEPVFIVGQSAGTFIYLRNLILIYRTARNAPPPSSVNAPPIPERVKGDR